MPLPQLNLFPEETTPYIIVTPQYSSMSAGIRALHMLCHSLNMLGQHAYIYTYRQFTVDPRFSSPNCPDLCTPLITQNIISYFEQQGRHPIVVYPESISGNPLGAKHIIRYILNYPNLLGGDQDYDAHEMVYAYSRTLAEYAGIKMDRVLFLPASDPKLFTPPPANTPRHGSCFYAAKYRDFHKGTLLPITANSTEITRYQPDSPTKQQIAELFRKSEIFYTYEDTALAIEAALCGCPTVFIPNEHLRKSLGLADLGMDGFAWGTDPDEIARAKATVHKFRDNYEAVMERYWLQLQNFITQTQKYAAESTSTANTHITLSALEYSYCAYLLDYIRKYGMLHFIRKAYSFTNKWGVARIMSILARS